MEPNEGETLEAFLGRGGKVQNWIDGMYIGFAPAELGDYSNATRNFIGATFTDSVGTVPTTLARPTDGRNVRSVSVDVGADEFRVGGHTYRRIDEAGKPVLPPACATLAGLLAFVLAHPQDGGGVAALGDRLAESKEPHREVPEVVGALVEGIREWAKAAAKMTNDAGDAKYEANQFREMIGALEADNRALRQRVGSATPPPGPV
jgi:hypothetical protein